MVGLEPVSVVLGSTMTLSCQLSRAAGDVLWRHNGKEIKPGGRSVIRVDGAQCLLTVTSVAQEDEGEYSCECKDVKTTAKISTKGMQSLHGTAEFSYHLMNVLCNLCLIIIKLHNYLFDIYYLFVFKRCVHGDHVFFFRYSSTFGEVCV